MLIRNDENIIAHHYSFYDYTGNIINYPVVTYGTEYVDEWTECPFIYKWLDKQPKPIKYEDMTSYFNYLSNMVTAKPPIFDADFRAVTQILAVIASPVSVEKIQFALPDVNTSENTYGITISVTDKSKVKEIHKKLKENNFIVSDIDYHFDPITRNIKFYFSLIGSTTLVPNENDLAHPDLMQVYWKNRKLEKYHDQKPVNGRVVISSEKTHEETLELDKVILKLEKVDFSKYLKSKFVNYEPKMEYQLSEKYMQQEKEIQALEKNLKERKKELKERKKELKKKLKKEMDNLALKQGRPSTMGFYGNKKIKKFISPDLDSFISMDDVKAMFKYLSKKEFSNIDKISTVYNDQFRTTKAHYKHTSQWVFDEERVCRTSITSPGYNVSYIECRNQLATRCTENWSFCFDSEENAENFLKKVFLTGDHSIERYHNILKYKILYSHDGINNIFDLLVKCNHLPREAVEQQLNLSQDNIDYAVRLKS